MATLYKRKDSPYWWCWGRYPNGERWSVSTRQRGRREAAQAARAIERERLNEADSGDPPIPLFEALAIFRSHKVRKGCGDATLGIFDNQRKRLQEHFGEEFDVLTLSLADVERYVDTRRKAVVARVDAEGERCDQQLSDHTIAKELTLLKGALRHLRRHGLYPTDPATLWPEALEAVYQPRDRWLTVDEYRRLLAALPAEKRRYVVLWCHTGMRWSELWGCVRRGDELVVTQTKGNRRTGEVVERVVPLDADAAATLDAHPLPWPAWNQSNCNRDLASTCRTAGIGRVSPNDFRRTFCSWLCQAGVPELTVTRLMGHSSSEMVRRVYAQLAPSTLAAAVALLPKVTSAEGEADEVA